MTWEVYAFIFTLVYQLVESRQCTYPDGTGQFNTFFCMSYEFCCGSGCCRPIAVTFYQLWYFWLSVILILIFCFGASWWYRFKNRGRLYSQHSAFAGAAAPGPSDPLSRNTSGVLYCPSGNRVYFQAIHKDHPLYQFMGGGVLPLGVAPPGGAHIVMTGPYPPPPPPHPGSMGPLGSMGPHPPPYSGPPPSYDAVVSGTINAADSSRPPPPSQLPQPPAVPETNTNEMQQNTTRQ